MDFEENRPVNFEREEELALSDSEGKNYFIKESKEADQLNYRELAEYIDDIEENVEAARVLGINGIVFRNTRQLQAELRALNVRI